MMNVRPKVVSLVSEELKTFVRLVVVECDRLSATTGVGYGTWFALRHHKPTGNGWRSAWKLYRKNIFVLSLML